MFNVILYTVNLH